VTQRYAVAVLGLATLWLAGCAPGTSTDSGAEADAAAAAYDYEARGVTVRQMGTDGALLYQIEAREVRQLPDSGRIEAAGLTLTHDPPGTEPGGRNRWTLTADRAELPPDGKVVTLAGNVRATGRPVEGNAPLTLTTESLRYDMVAQEVTTDAPVTLGWGRNTLQGRALRANIRTGSVALEANVHGTFSP
jgi:LPS export ABC transporter protein LptC